MIVQGLYTDGLASNLLWELKIYSIASKKGRAPVEERVGDLRRYKYRLLSARCCMLSTLEGKRIVGLLRGRVADTIRGGGRVSLGPWLREDAISPCYDNLVFLVRWRGVLLPGSEAKRCTVHASITSILISGSVQYCWRIFLSLVPSAPASSPRIPFLWQILLIHSFPLGRLFACVICDEIRLMFNVLHRLKMLLQSRILQPNSISSFYLFYSILFIKNASLFFTHFFSFGNNTSKHDCKLLHNFQFKV